MSAANDDFATRANGPGVVRFFGFDDPTALAGPYSLSAYPRVGRNYMASVGAVAKQVHPTMPWIDTEVSASGAGSLAMQFLSESGEDACGQWYANYSPDLSVRFGENSEHYIQFRVRMNAAMLATAFRTATWDGVKWTPTGGYSGPKICIVDPGDEPPSAQWPDGKQWAFCEKTEIVLTRYGSHPFWVGYNECGAYRGFYQPYPRVGSGDFLLQNAVPDPPRFSAVNALGPASVDPVPGAFTFLPDQWMTVLIGITTGARDRVNRRFLDSRLRVWFAYEGQAYEPVIDWRPGIEGYFALCDGEIAAPQSFGKITLTAYMTGKDVTQIHDTCRIWYDELIVSRAPIAAPGASQIVVGPPALAPTIANFQATPSALPYGGGSASLNAEIANAKTLLLNGEPVAFLPTSVSITAGTTFTLVARGDAQPDATATLTVAVASVPTLDDVAAKLQDALAEAQTVPAAASVWPLLQGALDYIAGKVTGNPKLANLAPNTWIDLGVMSLTVPNGETLVQALQVGSNSGCDYDARRNRLVVFGGGHSATNYDAVVCLSLDDLIWREEYLPTWAQPDMTLTNYDVSRGAWLSGSDGGPYPRPAARHTCDQMQVLGDELILFGLVEGNGENTQQAVNEGLLGAGYLFSSKAQIARYSFANKTWSFESASPTQTDGDGGVALWGATKVDPVTGIVLWVNVNYFATYDPRTRSKTKWVTWAPAKGAPALFDESGNPLTPATLAYTGSLCYDSIRDQWYYCTLHDEVWRLNYDRAHPAATTMTRLSVTGVPPTNAHPVNSEHAHRFDSRNGVIGVGPFDGVFYTFDPASKAWSSTVLPTSPLSQYGNSHCMEYIDGLNVYLLMTDRNLPIAALRSHWIAYRWR